MKFLHTADWQIGMKAAYVGEAAERVREERLRAARRVVEAAKEHAAEFLVVAGDTFEDNGVDRLLVQKVADILLGFGGPVYVIPGNHDPFVPGSVWEHPAWKSADDLHVLTTEENVPVAGGVLFPCPVREKHSGKDPTAWIPKDEGQGVRIGIAHGTVEGIHQDEPEYPVPRDAAQQAALDYLALGHWHSTALYQAPDGAVRMAYCGTHETTRFGERDSGNVLLIEIAKARARPVVTPVRTGGLVWTVIEEELREAGDVTRIVDRISQLENAEATLLDLRLRGVLAPSDCEAIAHLKDLTGSRFLYVRLDDSALHPSPEDDSWLTGLPPGVLREAGVRLRELADSGYDGERPLGATPEVAARALIELFALLKEADA